MPAQRLDKFKRAAILAVLCEGNGINGICRMFSVGKNTVLRLIKETGEACEDWHDRHFRNLAVQRLELDEQWSFINVHRDRMTPDEKKSNPEWGDAWLQIGIDPESKAIVSWSTGKRTANSTLAFSRDLASPISGRVQITTDLLASYRIALPKAFGSRAVHAQEEKQFSPPPSPAFKWLKAPINPLVGVKRRAVTGQPDLNTATVCHAERWFCNHRQLNRRCTRKTLGHSKTLENHSLAASIHIFAHNMIRRHEAIKTTPAVKLGVATEAWTLERLVDMTDEYLRRKEDAKFEAAFANVA